MNIILYIRSIKLKNFKIMKKLFIILFVLIATYSTYGQKYEYLQFSAIESVVPGGLGRSRIITTDAKNQEVEVELKNFYSMVGINFGNIRNNDQVIVKKINELAEEGWELIQVVSAVESTENKTGICISRYIFKRPKN